MSTVPAWLLQASDELKQSEERHSWMCDQLVHRRNAQILDGTVADVNTHTLGWYKDHLTWILDENLPSKVVEVLSDGLGFIEPNWHAVNVLSGDRGGLTKLTHGELEQLKGLIAKKRHLLTGTAIKTQRAIGQDLYEPGLFLVTEDRVFFYRPGGRATINPSGSASATWVDLSGGFTESRDLPVIERTETRIDKSREIAVSLGRVTREVLWKCMLPPNQKYFSLILIHTSLWQETAGVWALHIATIQNLVTTPRAVDLRDIRRLIEPPAYCLEDVLGWSYEFEGTHRWKRNNVDFLRECLGMGRPTWTPDGIAYNAGDGQAEKDADRGAYELSVECLPSRTIREILRQAIKQLHSQEHAAEVLVFESLTPASQKIVRAVEATVIGLRLGDLETLLARSSANRSLSGEPVHEVTGGPAMGVSDLPDTIDLYLKLAETALGICVGSVVTDPVARGKGVVRAVQEALPTVVNIPERDYCSTVIRCLDNYLEKLVERRFLGQSLGTTRAGVSGT